ncbi:MAG: VOC family protein [Chitinophagaceae bacterium]|nr:VOC family protein [Chitinophagaceae bacterium]
MNLSNHYQTVMPYLLVQGALSFVHFTREVFDAEVKLNMHKMHEDGKTVIHTEIQIGDSTLMIADATNDWPAQAANLFVYVKNADETFRKAIANGSRTLMEMADREYGRTGGITDPFGNVWWITTAPPDAVGDFK